MFEFIESMVGYNCGNVAYSSLSPVKVAGALAVIAGLITIFGGKKMLQDKAVKYYLAKYESGEMSKEEGQKKATAVCDFIARIPGIK